MRFKQFSNKIKSSVLQLQVVEQASCFNIPLYKTADGKVYIDTVETEFESLEEARSYIKEQNNTQVIEQEVSKNIYEDVLENKIASIIKSENDIKVTQSILEHYIDLASSKAFTIDETVIKIRKLNKHDCLFEDKIDFVLKDNTKIVISNDTRNFLNSKLQNHSEVVEYMSEGKENFTRIYELLIGESYGSC
jgi:hypothetical protein